MGAVGPVMESIQELQKKEQSNLQGLKTEYDETDERRVLETTQKCAEAFARALKPIMQGQQTVRVGRITLEEELRTFHQYHEAAGSDNFEKLPYEGMESLDDYIQYLTQELNIGHADGVDDRLNGGAQYRRMMDEVEVFLRFSEITQETTKQDVIQARGVSMTSLTWRDVVVKVLSHEAHLPLEKRVTYVAERIKYFFVTQKEPVLEWMEIAPDHMQTEGQRRSARLINQNEMVKQLVYQTWDAACERQRQQFLDLFEQMLTSTFSNPWVFLKGATVGNDADMKLPPGKLGSLEHTQERIPQEIKSRSSIERTLSQWLRSIPEEAHEIDDAVDKVSQLVLKTYSFIRSQVCDQVELFAESFFKMPMLRKLEDDMSKITLSNSDKENYAARRERLVGEIKKAEEALKEINDCDRRLKDFKVKCEATYGF